jgi:hypothetical protein
MTLEEVINSVSFNEGKRVYLIGILFTTVVIGTKTGYRIEHIKNHE